MTTGGQRAGGSDGGSARPPGVAGFDVGALVLFALQDLQSANVNFVWFE